MPGIKKECIEHIKAVADLYDIVSGYVQLKRSGSNWKGLSPFTVEKTPSFFVLPEKKFFKCFSTGYAGDVIRFLELKENFSFREAVEWLAKRYGIKIEYDDGRPESYSKNELFEIHESAQKYYRQEFLKSKEVQRYWTETRQFSLDAAERYGIGWAPIHDHTLLALLKKRYSAEAVQECGLFFANEQKIFHTRFSGRLMIPIYDVQDRIIGFSGRILQKRDDVSKYINSPETPIFHKGNVLYGLNHARRSVKDQFIIVEGQLDALRCWESGLHEAVAPQGTGITETQMNCLRRYAPRILCLTDGDLAGQKCALRIIELAFKTNMECQVVTLNPDDDPDSLLLREGKMGFDRLKKVPMIPYLINAQLPKGADASVVEKEQFLRSFYELLNSCSSEVMRYTYLEEMASRLNLDKNAVRNDFENFCGDAKFVQRPVENEKKSEKLSTAEHDLLSLILHYNEVGEKVSKVLEDSWVAPTNDGKLLLKVIDEIRKGTWEGPQNDSTLFSDGEINQLFSILVNDEDNEDPVAAVNVCLKAICGAFAKNKLAEINQKEKERRKFTKNLLDDLEFFKNLQSERLCLRKLLFSCPEIEA